LELTVISNIMAQVVTYSSIYALAGLGIIMSGRVGIFNISGEGVMLTAASAGFSIAFLTGSWVLGTFCGAIVGVIFGIVFIIFHERLRVDQFILGICLIIAGAALSDLIDKMVTGIMLSTPQAPRVPCWTIPIMSQIPVIGGFFDQNILTYFTYGCIVLIHLFLYRTKRGLEFRSIGENPRAADVVGIPVMKIRLLFTILGSALIGVAGSYLPLVVTGAYSTGMVAGRGFMTIGIAIFASWKPRRVFVSALIFAFFEVLALQLQLIIRKQQYIFIIQTLPFLGVLMIMMLFKKHIEFPASLGSPYYRE
jgi:general nucleoside transport system permease protein